MFLKWANIIGISAAIFAAIFAIALRVANDREKACAKICIENGYVVYEYKGFSGNSRKSVKPDVCTCSNKDGSSKVFMGSSLW